MKKAKSNASWNKLTPKQRETLDRWLFEENLSYAVIFAKVPRADLGYKGSETSLRRYYERRRQERLLTDLKEVGQDMIEVRGLDADPNLSRKVSMQMLGAYLFRVLREAPDKVKEWAPVANLLVRNDYNEIMREAKAREHQIREKAMAFAKERYEFDMMEKALQALPELLELQEAKKDPATKRYEENARWNRVRRKLFSGSVWAVRPESPSGGRGGDDCSPDGARRAKSAGGRAEAGTRAGADNEAGTADAKQPVLQRVYGAAGEEGGGRAGTRNGLLREYQARAAEFSDVEQAKLKKLQEQQEAERAERRKQREERQARAQARLEEMREVCGWQEVQRPPGTEEGT